MAFDLSTAKPVKTGFDISTAKPISKGFDITTAKPVTEKPSLWQTAKEKVTEFFTPSEEQYKIAEAQKRAELQYTPEQKKQIELAERAMTITPSSPETNAAIAYEAAGIIKGLTAGYVSPEKYLEKTDLAKENINKTAALGAGTFIGAVIPISLVSKTVGTILRTSKLLIGVNPLLQGLVQAGITGQIYGTARKPEEEGIINRLKNGLNDAAYFITFTGTGLLFDKAVRAYKFGKTDAYNSFRKDIIKKFKEYGIEETRATLAVDAGLEEGIKKGGGWSKVTKKDIVKAHKAFKKASKEIIGKGEPIKETAEVKPVEKPKLPTPPAPEVKPPTPEAPIEAPNKPIKAVKAEVKAEPTIKHKAPFTVTYGTRGYGNKSETFDDYTEAVAFAREMDLDKGVDYSNLYDNEGYEIDFYAHEAKPPTVKPTQAPEKAVRKVSEMSESELLAEARKLGTFIPDKWRTNMAARLGMEKAIEIARIEKKPVTVKKAVKPPVRGVRTPEQLHQLAMTSKKEFGRGEGFNDYVTKLTSKEKKKYPVKEIQSFFSDSWKPKKGIKEIKPAPPINDTRTGYIKKGDRFIVYYKDGHSTGTNVRPAGIPELKASPTGEKISAEEKDFEKRFEASSRKIQSAEKTPERKMTAEESRLMSKDWKAYSRSRGYTEKEIADFEKHKELVKEGQKLGYTLDDLAGIEKGIASQIKKERLAGVKPTGKTTTAYTQPIKFKRKEIAKGHILGRRKKGWLLKKQYEPLWARDLNDRDESGRPVMVSDVLFTKTKGRGSEVYIPVQNFKEGHIIQIHDSAKGDEYYKVKKVVTGGVNWTKITPDEAVADLKSQGITYHPKKAPPLKRPPIVSGATETINEVDLAVGDEFTFNGETYKVKQKGDDFALLQDGQTVRLEDFQSFEIDKGSYKSAIPKASPEVKEVWTPPTDEQVKQADAIKKTTPLIRSLVKSYLRKGIDRDELEQVGRLAVLKALKTFDPKKAKLTTHAFRFISGAMRDFTWEHKEQGISIPEEKRRWISRVSRFENKFYMETGVLPTEKQITEALKLEPKQVEEAIALRNRTFLTFERPAPGKEDLLSYAETLPEYVPPEVRPETIDKTNNLMKGLNPAEKEAIELLTGIKTGSPMKVKEVGETMGLDERRAGELIKKAIAKMKAKIALPKDVEKIIPEKAKDEAATKQLFLDFTAARNATVSDAIDNAFGSKELADKAVTAATDEAKLLGMSKERAAKVERGLKTGTFNPKDYDMRDSKQQAAFFSLFRRPDIENLVFALTDNEGKILDYQVFTSNVIDTVKIEAMLSALKRAVKKFEPTAIYLGHNHPSGSVKPSKADLRSTQEVKKAFPDTPLKHIITDHKYYAVISGDGQYDFKPLPKELENWSGTGESLRTQEDMAKTAFNLVHRKDKVMVMFLSSRNKFLAGELFSKKMAESAEFPELISNLKKKYAAAYYSILSDKSNVLSLNEVYPEGLLDVIGVGTKDISSRYASGGLPAIMKKKVIEGFRVGEEEFNDELKKTNIKETKINLIDTIFLRREAVSDIKSILVRQQAERQIRIDRLEKFLRKTDNFFERKSDDFNLKFMDKMEKGLPQDTLELEKMAQVLRGVLKAIYDVDKSYEDKIGYIENYFPHIWKNIKKAKKFISAYVKKFSLNKPSFSKKRYYPLIADGMKPVEEGGGGLKLKTTNPVELVIMRADASAHNVMTKEIMKQLKERGLLLFQRGYKPPPPGWGRIKGERLRRYFPSKKGQVLAGEYVAPIPTANIMNRWLSPSLYQIEGLGGNVFKGIMKLKNVQAAVLLTFSGFHTIETGISSIATNLVVGVRQLSRLQIRQGLATLIEAPVFPFSTIGKAVGVRHAWYYGTKNPVLEKSVEIMKRGGMRPTMHKYWRIDGVRALKKAILNVDIPMGILNIIPALAEIASTPVMDWWVPQLKIAAYLKNAGDYLQAHPEASEIEQDKELRKIAWNIDARFGQIVYDNLFWNRIVRDALMGSSLSLGWQVGNFDQILGGGYDFAESMYNLIYGKAKLLPGKPGTEPIFTRKREANFSDKVLYLLIYPFVVAVFGGLKNWALTGEKPKELLDYFYPRVGYKNPDGSEAREMIPSMTKEMFGLYEAVRKYGIIKGPPMYATHKLSPFESQFIDIFIRNKNFYNVEVRNPYDPKVKQAEQVLAYLASVNQSFSIQGYKRQKEMGHPSILPFLGMNPAPAYITKSPIQKDISDMYLREFAKERRTQKQWEKSQVRRKLMQKMQLGKRITSAERMKMIRDGVLSSQQYTKLYKMQRQGILGRGDIVMFQRLPEEDQLYLIDKMTESEKKTYIPYSKEEVRRKYPSYRMKRR